MFTLYFAITTLAMSIRTLLTAETSKCFNLFSLDLKHARYIHCEQYFLLRS